MNTNFFLNPKRIYVKTLRGKLLYHAKLPFIHFGLWLGFPNIEYGYVHGSKSRIKIGRNCSTMNTIFNVISGTITIGDNTLFGHNCMVLTGTHEFFGGIRGGLLSPPVQETPSGGRNIVIGSGCFIGSGVIIQGNLSIGNNVIVGAGAVVTRSLPNSCFAAGVPARVVKYLPE